MATDTGWRSQQRHLDSPTPRSTFPGQRPLEDTDGVDPSNFENSTFEDIAHQMPEVPSYVMTAGIALAAAAGGMAVGYWLGGRRATRRHSAFSFGDVDFADFAKLAPEAAHLLKNPLVRAYATKLLMRQVRRYLDS